ncbi:MAG TPA: methyltransferase domain-containing protein [Bryobacteraceae bacterium]|nr:methyltransferase domain-containing protein [Bryobacteraceae bacterium]
MPNFLCNLCGAATGFSPSADREETLCVACGCSMRMRGVIATLSRTLFQCEIPLPEFPALKAVKALGISDSPLYAAGLERSFRYTNTFFHQEPFLDIRNPSVGECGQYDFVICSEVLEHVPQPAVHAVEGLRKLLKPSGFLLVTVPYHLAPESTEHFPPFQHQTLATLGGEPILIGRDADGHFHVRKDLVFHGGPGSTLEHRQCSDGGIQTLLRNHGFPTITIDTTAAPAFGIEYDSPCSLPIIASQGKFVLPPEAVAELAQQYADGQTKLRQARESSWLRLGQRLGLGPRL